MLRLLRKNTTISTPFAPKLSYIFLMAFVVIFAGGSSVLYFKTLPDSRMEGMVNNLTDPYYVASQNLHQFDYCNHSIKEEHGSNHRLRLTLKALPQ